MQCSASEQARRLRRRAAIAVAVAAIIMTAIVAAVWWQQGETFWSNGADIYVAMREARARDVLWTRPLPLNLPVNETGTAADQFYEPSLSPDGNDLYFVRGKPGTGARIFTCHRHIGGGWTAPIAVAAVNGGDFDALGPRVTADGRFLLFSSNRPGGFGGYDIWAAPRLESDAGGGWGEPFNLGAPVNSEFNEYNPDPTPDGRRLIFSTDRRAASVQQAQAWRGTIRESATADFDLWIATIDADRLPAMSPSTQPSTRPAQWLAFSAAAEIRGVNTTYTEGASCMSPAGDFLYFASNRPGGYGKFDIYRSRVTGDLFGPPENLGPTINTAANETDPALALQGFRLCFSSDRSNSGGFYNLFSSDSREVFADERPRVLPRLGWSIWSLLGSAALLLPLIVLLHGTRNQRLSMLQRCMVLSLVVHAAAAFLFSFVIVTQEVTRYVRHDPAGNVNLNLNVPRDVEIGMAVRTQFSAEGGSAPEDDRGRPAIPASEQITRDVRITEADIESSDAPRSELARAMIERIPFEAAMLPLQRASRTSPSSERDATAGLDWITPRAPPVEVSLAKGAPISHSESPVQSREAKFESTKSAIPASAAKNAGALDGAFAGVDAPRSRPVRSSIGSPAALVTSRHDNTGSDALKHVQMTAPDVAVVEADLPPSVRPAQPRGPNKEVDPAEEALDVAVPTTQPLLATIMPGGSGEASGLLAGSTAPPVSAVTRPFVVRTGFRDRARPDSTLTATRSISAPPGAPAPIVPEIAGVGSPMAGTAVAGVEAKATEVTGDLSTRNVIMPSTRLTKTGVSITASEITVPWTQATPGETVPPSAIAAAQPTAHSRAQPLPFPAGVSLTPLGPDGPLGPGSVTAAESPFPRSGQQRQLKLQRNGGTEASEQAVDQGLAYLARVQQFDGRWTYELEDRLAQPRQGHAHDAACTGLALLALLARDHVPHQDGPYRTVVTKGLEYLLALQDEDGDLRGPPELRGPGPNHGNMYDHAIATLALGEAALMSHDRRYAEAARRGARFIIAAQDPRGGGWRYSPGDYGDSSVFGWQIMALHAAEQLGLEIPEATRENALRYVQLCGLGERRMLAGYQPGESPTAAMTAELLYSRMLLGQELDKDDLANAADFISRQAPGASNPDPYCWYYGSLCLLQVHSEVWDLWNRRTRDTLIGLQRAGEGPLAGSWNTNLRWGAQGGRVFTTSLAVLTLEVYYRYSPIQPGAP